MKRIFRRLMRGPSTSLELEPLCGHDGPPPAENSVGVERPQNSEERTNRRLKAHYGASESEGTSYSNVSTVEGNDWFPSVDASSSTEVPAEVQLWRLENIAVPACYLVVGTLQG